MKLYDLNVSSPAYRVRLMLSLLGQEYETQAVDLFNGEHKGEAFLKINPFGQVPTLEDNGFVTTDSHASLTYLAHTYGGAAWNPTDIKTIAHVANWMSRSANEAVHGLVRTRIKVLVPQFVDTPMEQLVEKSHALLKQMDAQLANQNFIAGDNVTIADIALYPPVAQVKDGNLDVSTYANVAAWMQRIEALNGFVTWDGESLAAAA